MELIHDIENFPVLVHTDHEYEENHPDTWGAIAKRFPKTDFIFAHGGKADFRKCASVANELDNVYIDTSTCSLNRTRQIFNLSGPEKMVFASDYPYSHPAIEITKYKIITDNQEALDVQMS